MNTVVIEKVQDGYIVRYRLGLNVRVGHEDMTADDEVELTEILSGEGVPEDKIIVGLGELEQDKTTTITFRARI